MVILILSYKPGISLHVPLPMNVANARYHSLLGDNIFQFWFTLRVSTASFKRLGEKACVPSPRRSHADNWQQYGRSTLMTGSCTVRFQAGCPSIRTSSTSTSGSINMIDTSGIFSQPSSARSPKGSQYQLVQVVSDTELL